MPLTTDEHLFQLETRVSHLERQNVEQDKKLDEILALNKTQSTDLKDLLAAWTGSKFTLKVMGGISAIIISAGTIWAMIRGLGK